MVAVPLLRTMEHRTSFPPQNPQTKKTVTIIKNAIHSPQRSQRSQRKGRVFEKCRPKERGHPARLVGHAVGTPTLPSTSTSATFRHAEIHASTSSLSSLCSLRLKLSPGFTVMNLKDTFLKTVAAQGGEKLHPNPCDLAPIENVTRAFQPVVVPVHRLESLCHFPPPVSRFAARDRMLQNQPDGLPVAASIIAGGLLVLSASIILSR